MYRIEASIVMKRPADQEVITAVNMVRMCQTLNVLPAAGGLLDQDAYFVHLFQVVLAADARREELEAARAKAK